MLKKINFKEFKNLYRKHIIQDFPKDERPNLSTFYKRINKKGEQAFIYEDQGKEQAYIIFKQEGKYIVVNFLAVYKEYRGKGIGTKLLKELVKEKSEIDGILLEVEDPKYAKNEDEKSIRERRIRFYEKLDYEIIQNLDVNVFSVPYKIMIYKKKDKKIEKNEIIKILEKNYEDTIGKYAMNKVVKISDK